jgi:hypothetical protein
MLYAGRELNIMVLAKVSGRRAVNLVWRGSLQKTPQLSHINAEIIKVFAWMPTWCILEYAKLARNSSKPALARREAFPIMRELKFKALQRSSKKWSNGGARENRHDVCSFRSSTGKMMRERERCTQTNFKLAPHLRCKMLDMGTS